MAQLKKLAVLVVLLAIPALLFAQAQDQQAEQPAAEAPAAEAPAEEPAAEAPAAEAPAAEAPAAEAPAAEAPAAEAPAAEAPAAEAPAAEAPADQTAQAEEQAGQMNIRLSEAIGIALSNSAGDITGTLNDLVVTPQGDIPYAVVAFTAPADVATQDQYLVPVENISVASTGMEATLDLAAADIQGLQKLENGQLPAELAMAAAAPEAPAAEAPAAEAPAAAGHFLATQLQGIAVMGANDQELGTVQDAMMDLAGKKIAYVALAPAGILGLGDKMFAVPVDQISNIDVNQGRMMVNISQDQLRSNEGFTQDQWPNQAPAWSMDAGTTEVPAETPATEAPAQQ